MKSYSSQAIRNVGLFGHGSSGKTSLAEAVLYHTGAINRLGKVDEGSTTTDHDPDEIHRKMTISLALAPAEWQDHKINLLDTPGYADFFGEVVQAMRVVECALIVVDAGGGLQVGTMSAWAQAEIDGVARIIFINKLERENADYGQVLEQLRGRWGTGLVPLTVPIGAEAAFSGVVDLLKEQAILDEKAAPSPIPPEMADEVARWREMLIESVAELDDELLAKYLDGETIPSEQLAATLRQGVRDRKLVPVLAGSALHGKGIASLLNALVELAPPASEATARIAEGSLNGGVAALVFKTISDPFLGRQSFLRAYAGDIRSDSHLWNATHHKEERVGQLFYLRGKHQEPTAVIAEGDIGAVAKLGETSTGDTLITREHPVVLERPHFPDPLFSVAIEPKTKGDLEKMGPALTRMVEEDPTLSVHHEQATNETILSGLGESHVEIACDRMHRKFGVQVTLATPRVAYRETIRGSAKAEGRYVRQTGGHGQYGVCWVQLEPLPRGGGFEFRDKIVGGVVSQNFRPAVEKGIRESMEEGILTGYPMVDFRATLYDGKEHPVDSSEMAFKIAGSLAFKKAATDAGVELLEPIAEVEILVPEEFTGEVVGDLNTKRAHLHGMNPEDGGLTNISANVPQAELLRYATDLRALTQGRGTYKQKFSHYQEVPAHLAQQIADKLKAEREAAK
ncbi:MAG: elongation factor G [Chloroflexi bacterium]|nr:elongation factor G [Chloroflexota bacterium]